ncbi:sigma-54-dependent Fis family transcriptional regulator [Beijerinckiaceae bacterium]|nr:sigma-54-dependent Fis family transcriptional regulator [Beijerinckiaceae bacterium]
MSPKILIADDDPVQRQLLETLVHRFGYQTETAESGEATLARLERAGEPIDLLILDLVMPDTDGMTVLSRLRESGHKLPVLVETSRGSIESVVSALRLGANDFVVKPVGAERLQVSIKNALAATLLEDEVGFLNRRATASLSFDDLAAKGDGMERVVQLGQRAAKSIIPVLLEGEAGTGKELIARAIHGVSERRGRPFKTVHCNILTEHSADAVLFANPGAFVESHGGTLFLDQICALPLDVQAKLLRALQEGEVHPAGTKRPVKADVRLISATTQNLIELVKLGRFREDLYYRINVFPVFIPPLRARPDDIAGLARRLCARFAAEEGKRLRGVCAEALALLCAYDWPGNVRQLENAVFRAVVLADGDELTVAEFPQIAKRVEGFDVRVPAAPAPGASQAPREREFVRVEVRDPNVLALLDQNGNARSLEQLEAEAIKFALVHYRGQMSAVARKLGIGRSTLYRKLRQYHIEPDKMEALDLACAEGRRDEAAA